MKNSFALSFACFAIVLLIGVSTANANDAFAKKILKFYPQTDTNGDGVLSTAEEASLSRKVLQRHSRN